MGIDDDDSFLARSFYTAPATPLRRWSRGAKVVLLLIPALLIAITVAVVAFGGDGSSSDCAPEVVDGC